tara:strand:- start:6100 stop:6966 length:867 start_codon:yes stop_codon:yes gene_type:complete
LFDVIVPLYNVKREWVDRCLESIHNQTFHNYQVWICDGSPKDENNKEITELISQKYPQFNYVRQTGIGVGQARNQAIRLGDNPYVAFLDGDDYWYPNWLEQASTYIDNHALENQVILIGEAEGTIEMVSKMKGTKWETKVRYHAFDPSQWLPEYHYYYIPKHPLFPSFTIMKRERIEESEGFREDIGVMEDIIFCSQMCGDKMKNKSVFQVAKLDGLFGWKEAHENNSAFGGNQSGLSHQNYNEHKRLCGEVARQYYVRNIEDKPEDIELEWWNYYTDFATEKTLRLI